MRTKPRDPGLNDLEPLEAAARVDQFLGVPQTRGPWSIKPFTVSKEAAQVDYLRSFGDGGGRYAPAGSYLKLEYDGDPYDANAEDGSDNFVMMSNTPNEIEDHAQVFDHAQGRVLVHGLGLSCVVSGLLAKPEVDHIDVVDNDKNVLALVAPAYRNESRVTIHQGNCLTYEWPDDARWDFVWHDIWARISDTNLIDDEAENGVSYGTLFRRFADRADFQQAWAFDLALAMRKSEEFAEQHSDALQRKWQESNREERMEMQLDFMFNHNPIVEALRGEPDTHNSQAGRLLMEQDTGLKAQMEERVEHDDVKFWVDSHRFLGQAKLLIPSLLEREYAKYGLVPDGYGLATRPIGVS